MPHVNEMDEVDQALWAQEEQRLRQLFSSAESQRHEQRLDQRVSELAREFLQNPISNSYIELNTLLGMFRETEVAACPIDPEDYLQYLSATVVPHSNHTSAPSFIGHMTSALPYFLRPFSKLVVALNQNMVKVETAKALTPCERQVLAIMHRLVFDFDDEFYQEYVQDANSTLGMIVSGGTQGNLAALWCARNSALGKRVGFAGIEQEGLAAALEAHDCRSAVIIGSQLMHYSLLKAADVLGLGTRGAVQVRVDRDQRIDLAELRRTLANCRDKRQRIIAIVGVAGTTESGAIDPLGELAEICDGEGIHFHVDAAWGGPLAFSRRHRCKLAGIERADSVVIDGHKQLYLPLGIGMVLLRSPSQARVIEKNANYIVRANSLDLGKRSPEGSRPGNVLLLHAALQIIGQRGYEFLVDENIRRTGYMAQLIQSNPAFELLAQPQTNILLYRYVPEPFRKSREHKQLTAADQTSINAFNLCLQKTERERGKTFVSRTKIIDHIYGTGVLLTALRVVIANPLTSELDIDSVLTDQLTLAAELSTALHGPSTACEQYLEQHS